LNFHARPTQFISRTPQAIHFTHAHIMLQRISPAAARRCRFDGGPLALLRDGDVIVIDSAARTLDAEVRGGCAWCSTCGQLRSKKLNVEAMISKL